MEVVARELLKRHQDQPVYWNHFAWAVRCAESIETANDILMEAVKKFHAAGLLSKAGLDAVLAR